MWLSIFKQFAIWAMIMVYYKFSRYSIRNKLNEGSEKDLTFLYQLYLYLSIAFFYTVVAFGIYYLFSKDHSFYDGDQDSGYDTELTFQEGFHFHFLQVYVPMIIPCLFGCYKAIKDYKIKLLKNKEVDNK